MYATFTNNESDNEISVTLSSYVSTDFTKVGVVEVFYNPNENIDQYLSEVERTVNFVYDFRNDSETKIEFKKTNETCSPSDFFKKEFFYSSLSYLDEDIPLVKVSFLKSSKNEWEHFSFHDLLKKNYVLENDFNYNVTASDSVRKCGFTNKTFYVTTREVLPTIKVTMNKSAYDLIDFAQIGYDKVYKPPSDNRTPTTYTILKHGFTATLRPINLMNARVAMVKKIFHVYQPLQDGFSVSSKPFKFEHTIADFIKSFNANLGGFIKHVQPPGLAIKHGYIYSTAIVSHAWKINMHDKLYKHLGLEKNVWYSQHEGIKVKSYIPYAISVKCNLVFDDQSGVHNQIIIFPRNERGWYRPKRINYVPLAINNIRHVKIYLTDEDDNLICLNNKQYFIVLHFK